MVLKIFLYLIRNGQDSGKFMMNLTMSRSNTLPDLPGWLRIAEQAG